MNRYRAGRAVAAETSLTMAETLTMMMLLDRAHNDTLEIPDWLTPTLPQLAAEVRVSVRWQRDLLTHLGSHTWVKVVPGRGRGHKSTYMLLPAGVAGDPCDCRKRGTGQHRKPPPGQHRKRGTAHPLSEQEKGNWGTPFTARKGELGQQEKGKSNGATPQVSPGFALRVNKGEAVQGACIGGCGNPARRGCRTCWECARLELVSS